MDDDSITSKRWEILGRGPLPRSPRDLKDRNPAAPRIISTAAYETREQFEVWRTRVSSLWDVTLPPGARVGDGFTAEYMICNLANVVISSGLFSAQAVARLPDYAHRSPIDHWFLIRARSGDAWFETGERQMHARPGDMYLISLDQDFRGLLTDHNRLTLALPRDAFPSVAATLDSVCNTVLSGNLARLLADYLDSLETRVVGMSPEELVQAGRATVDMIAACIQPSRDSLHVAGGAIEAALFERARSYIRLHLGNPDLTPDHLTRALRVSRSNLYRAFEHVGGVSRYVQRTRLLAARAALNAGDDRRIQEIAYSHGFKLASDFTRAFRREFAYSPREARDARLK
jgi:AraC-like DNA-binding protein